MAQMTPNRIQAKKRKLSMPFKSPLQSKEQRTEDLEENEEKVRKEIAELKKRIEDVDKEIEELHDGGYKVEELQDHMTQMHQYNDMKDTGQLILGQLAQLEGVTTRSLYAKYGLDVND